MQIEIPYSFVIKYVKFNLTNQADIYIFNIYKTFYKYLLFFFLNIERI